ncbi:hypothetical protein Aspvir_009776 [Aspergillus viridinutans]|uniref:CFEM domain-containing protein n=1 Tax=Aspergillus viridinutans TaxID=75553 RepID=A0A9P3C048_ASPVI|nr:uncharacterized protein Aspvir_009776 [Aspergillus viridinutans]GIK05663.1 hypothetical protein Aspvir_009776 [Aspergillus viridinutans]
MHFSRASIALLAAGLVSAQLPNVPACSLNCFVSALSADGCSSLTDFACHCQKPDLVPSITPCVQSACNIADQSSVSSAVVSQCSAAGHPISVPSVGAASTTASETTTTTESSTQTVTTTTTSSTGSTTSSSTVSSTTSSSPASSSHHHSSSSASTTRTLTSTESSSASTSASASATTTLSNNAGSDKANVAGVAAVAAAALYLL